MKNKKNAFQLRRNCDTLCLAVGSALKQLRFDLRNVAHINQNLRNTKDLGIAIAALKNFWRFDFLKVCTELKPKRFNRSHVWKLKNLLLK
jgi:hypothetical protein